MRARVAAARFVALAAAATLLAFPAEAAPRRVVSLDQCADQYVLALAPRGAIVGLSPRADDADAWMRAEAKGLPRMRPTLEAVTAARPEVAVRYWGGDPKLMRALQRQGVKVVQIDDAAGFDTVAANIRKAAAGLEAQAAGERLVAEMDARLARSRGAWRGERALYMTPSGFTSGPGTLMDALLRAAGLVNAVSAPTFAPLSLEALVLAPPRLFVMGFFDNARGDHWGGGRHPVLRRLARGRTVASLPGAMLGCPIWAAAEGAERLAKAAPR